MRRVLIAAVPLVMLVGCAANPDATPATETVTVTATADAEPGGEVEPDAEAEVEPVDDAPEVEPEGAGSGSTGTRGAPLPPGTTVTLGDWEVTVRKTDTDVMAQLLEENRFNDEPGDGNTFAMAPVEVTYIGDGSDTPWVSLSFRIVGGDGNTYDDRCGVIPSPLRDINEMYTDASASGNVCVEVAEAALDGAAWRVTESFSFDDAEAWFALTK